MTKLKALAAEWWPDALLVAGAGAVAYGAGLLHPAAGWMVGGAFLLAGGVLGGRR